MPRSANAQLAIDMYEALNRLEKVLSNCPPAQPHGALTAAVHFAPHLITGGLGENGRMMQLRSLDWLIGETFQW